MASPRTAPMLITPEDAHPELGTLRNAITARDWRTVEQVMAGLPDDTARIYAMTAVADVPGSDEFLSGMVAAEPDTALPRAMLAYRYIWLAWDARTAARAVHVSSEQFEAFRHYLNLAEEQLILLAARHPTYQPTYPARLTTAMGLQLGMAEVERRYWTAPDPYCYPAQTRMLKLLCPKWGGDMERMFDFVRECVRTAPAGSITPVLIAEAHLEPTFDHPRSLPAYLRRPEVLAEIRAAAEKSVLHPDCRPGYYWVEAHSMFAFVFSAAGEKELAARHFRALGPLAWEQPWLASTPQGMAALVGCRTDALGSDAWPAAPGLPVPSSLQQGQVPAGLMMVVLGLAVLTCGGMATTASGSDAVILSLGTVLCLAWLGYLVRQRMIAHRPDRDA